MVGKHKFLVCFVFSFASVILGTLSHEAGHYLVARSLGYDSKISYDRTVFAEAYQNKYLDPVLEKYDNEIQEGRDFPGRQEYERRSIAFERDHLFVIAGGPMITFLLSITGLFLLFRKVTTPAVFLSLFSLRFPFVLFTSLLSFFRGAQVHSDEVMISAYLDIPMWTISIVMGAIGSAIAFLVIFGFVPKNERLAFLLSLLSGILMGYLCWFYGMGEFLLP